MAEEKHHQIADKLDSVSIIISEKKPTTVSEHMLQCIEQVQAQEHKSKVHTHFEIAFLELVLANHAQPKLQHLFLARRKQFLSDSVIANFSTAIYFLKYNSKYAALDFHDRERALLAHKKSEEEKDKKTVTAIITQTSRRGGHGRGRGRGRGRRQQQQHYYQSQDYQSYNNYYGQQQYQEPPRQGGHQQQMFSPMKTRGGQRFGYDNGRGGR